MGPVPLAMVGPYKLIDLLGKGGMGEVYRARDERLGREVAIKILSPSYATDADRLIRFDQEARAAAKLNHPNILAVYDIGSCDGRPYIVSELLRGLTLRDVLGHGRLAPRKAVQYGVAIASGLAAAHDKEIIHRDIKPENVFVTNEGTVKILDFGIAKLRERVTDLEPAPPAPSETTASVLIGTPGYMSPEQVRGEPLDHRSDIFGLGATLYEMLTGRRPFAADSAVETMSTILKHDPPMLSAIDDRIPPALASIVQHCLEKERDLRFQSARDLAFALSRLGGPPRFVVPERRDPARRLARGVLITGAAAAVALAAGTFLGRDASPPTFQRVTFRRGHIANARFAPDGQTVISNVSWDGKPFEVLSTRLDTTESAALPIAGAWLYSVSRAGELAVAMKGSILARVPIGGAGPRELLESVSDADWGGDGSLAVIRHDSSTRRAWVEYPIGKPLYEPSNGVNLVRVSPDGTLVAVLEQTVAGGGPEWLTIIDRAGTVVSRSQQWASSVNDSLAWTPDGGEVWFTASETGGRAAVHAMSRGGRERVVHRAMSPVRILDVAPDGRALLANDTFWSDMILVDTRDGGERELTWSDWCRPLALSNDGRTLAFGDLGRSTRNGKAFGYIRQTDGSPAIQITDAGSANDISPDGKWILVNAGLGARGARHFTLMPSGAGEPRNLDPGRIVEFSGISNGSRWMPDGQRIVFVGNEPGRPRRVFIQKVAGGPPQALTPEGAFGPLAVSPDSTEVIAKNQKGQLSRYFVAGGEPLAIVGAVPGDQPLAWSGASIWVLSLKTTPAKIFRIELGTGRRTLWRDVPYPDPAATDAESLRVVMSADGSRFVYGYQKHLSDLYVATGLR